MQTEARDPVTKSLPDRLTRYEKAHRRALAMAGFLQQLEERTGAELDRAWKLQECGTYLVFRQYAAIDQTRLHAARFCQQDRLCPLCAIRRGAKLLRAYTERLLSMLAAGWKGECGLVTFTVKNGPDLAERFAHLTRSMKKLNERRQDYLTRPGYRWTEAATADTAVTSIEVKRGSGSGIWHPHAHAAWLCPDRLPDKQTLSREWNSITGDSHQVDVRPFRFQAENIPATADAIAADFAEVFKYALKFSSMSLADNWHAFETLFRRRLISSFGVFRTIQEPVDLNDDQVDLADLPYIELLYRFENLGGYVLQPITKSC